MGGDLPERVVVLALRGAIDGVLSAVRGMVGDGDAHVALDRSSESQGLGSGFDFIQAYKLVSRQPCIGGKEIGRTSEAMKTRRFEPSRLGTLKASQVWVGDRRRITSSPVMGSGVM